MGVVRIVSYGLVWAVLVASCGAPGLSEDRVVATALQSLEGQATVVSVRSGSLGDFTDMTGLRGERADRQVWSVIVIGSFPGECVRNAAGQEVCPRPASRKQILLDFQTGALVLAESI
jgi:hypothetical protein